MNPDDPRKRGQVAEQTSSYLRGVALRLLFAGEEPGPEDLTRFYGVICAAAALLHLYAADDFVQAAREVPPVPAPAAPAAPGHRHVFGADGVCACGRAKSKAGRKSAAALATVAGVTKFDPPSVPLPLGDAAADKFAGGGMGSSGAVRR